MICTIYDFKIALRRMSINIEINRKQLSEKLALHYLPAGIEGDGEANVDDYFNNYTSKEDGNLTNALRGFPLNGIDFELPTKLTGVVFQETNVTLDETAKRLFRVTGTFNKFTYWNYDKVPSPADALRQAMQVSIISDELSKVISAEDMEKELSKMQQS